MNSQPVFSRGSTQVLGNMPFSSEFATGSALDITDKKLDELTLSVSGVNYHLTEVESTRPTRDEIDAISGDYASHDEVQEWAGKASALAIEASQETLENTATEIRNSISALEDNCQRWDAAVLKTAEEYSSANLRHVSAFLYSTFDERVNTEISDRKAAVSGEFDRASGEEYRIETKFDGLCATLSADISAVSAISKAEDARIDRRIDSYQQVFSAALDSISATARHADEEHQFNDFISEAGIHYSSDAHTMYLGHEKVVDLSVSGDLKTSGNLNTVDIKARDIEANDIGMRSLTANDIEVTAFVAGSGANKIEYEGGDTVSFGNAMFTVSQGNINYSLDPAVSYKNGAVKLGNSVPHDPVSSISIGNGNADKNHSIVIATQDVTKANAVANGAGTINLYAENDENNVYIGTSSIPEIITKYAASKADLENEVREGIESTSGIIRSGIQHEVEQAVSADIRATELNLSAYVNEETQKRIDDVQSVRDELPFYLHTSGGTIWGDLTVNNVNLFDLFSGAQTEFQHLYNTETPQPISFLADWSTVNVHEYHWEWDGWGLAFSSGVAAMAKPPNGIDMEYSIGDAPGTQFTIRRENDVSGKFPIDPYEDVTTSSYTYTNFEFAPTNGAEPHFSIMIRPPSAQSEEDVIIEYVPSSDETARKYPYLHPYGSVFPRTYMSLDLSGTMLREKQYMLSNATERVVLYTPVSVLLARIENKCEPETVKVKVEVSGSIISEDVDTHQQYYERDVYCVKTFDCGYNESEKTYEGNGIKVLVDENKISATDYLIDITIDGAVHSAPINFVCEPFGSVTLAQYIDDQTRLTKHMLDVTTSAHNTSVSAYSVAVSAYDTATEAHDLIVQAQGVVASASSTATSAYNIAMSAYALSGVLQEVADYLRDINGEG